jgi:solute:Na+ symporter, SSS family
MNFAPIDIIIFSCYIAIIMSIALYVSRKKKGEVQTTNDFFLAGNTLPWWAIGTSLIAANISAEQLIGMTGDGFTMGFAIASYEWMAALTLLIVGKFFLPVFLEKKIYSMPNFLEMRYDGRVRTIMSILWLILYIFINLTSIMYLGGICIEQVFGVPLVYAIIAIAAFSSVYTIIGGLKAIAYTDFIQVGFLVIGGLITTNLALTQFSGGQGFLTGMGMLVDQFPQKFDMIFTTDSKYFADIPGFWGVFVFMWIMNLNYWGFNQYITQRALAAKSLKEAQKGVILAGFLKLLMPLIVVLPGIVAFALHAPLGEGEKDQVYPWLLNTFLTPGIKGVVFAAMVAAVVGSLSSKTNSIATIFTMDVYKPFFGNTKSDQQLVLVGRICTAVALVIAVMVAPYISLFKGGFQFIQVFTGFFSPGIFAIFIFGLFWRKANTSGALWTAALTLPVSLVLYFFFGDIEATSLVNLPFLYRMAISFVFLSGVLVFMSNKTGKGQDDSKAVLISKDLFKTSSEFNIGAIVIILITLFLYVKFW